MKKFIDYTMGILLSGAIVYGLIWLLIMHRSPHKESLSATIELPNGYRQIPDTHYVIDIDGDTLKQVMSVHYSYQVLTKRERQELYRRLQ